jgi:toxin-antitoxin system PIN domain toxin
VIVVDANLLIYSYDVNAAEHKKSAAWLEDAFSGPEIVGLPWPCICAFVRVVTNRRLPGTRVGLDLALGTIEEWLHSANVQALVPAERHWSVFRRMLVEGQVTGPLVTDAEIAALTIEYGGVLHTADRDFARFPGLRWVNPLA